MFVVGASAKTHQVGYATAQPACSAPGPGHASCFALVRERVSPSQAARPGVRPFVLRSGASVAGPAGGLTPAQLAGAYTYDPRSGGTGQMVAIVDAFDDPKIGGDLENFDTQYGLPACNEANGCFRKVGQSGSPTVLPSADTTGWSVEVALDVETVHSACPNCKIVLVESFSTTFSNLAAAENEAAALGATVISNSYGGPESAAPSVLTAYDHPGVAITASTGDGGYYGWQSLLEGFLPPERTNVPASLSSVVAVGGTTLLLDESGNRESETVWSGSGGGCSTLFTAALWQQAAAGYGAAGCGSSRLDADVSAVADPGTGFDIFDSYDCGLRCENARHGKNWLTVGGTSLSAPLIGALYGLAGGGGGVPFPSLTLYAHLAGPAVFDVTEGSNGPCGGVTCGINEAEGELLDCEGTTACNAGPGFDGPSGVGTPSSLALFAPERPSAIPSGPTATTVGVPITFSGAGSSDPYPGGSVTGYAWNWGDGAISAGALASHAYSAAGIYTVGLTVTDSNGVTSDVAVQTVAVTAPVATPVIKVVSFIRASPNATLAAGSLKAAANGAFTVKIGCPAGESSCEGTVTVQTAGAVVASGKARVLALATSSFKVAGGKFVTVKLHLSGKARSLLARKHTLSVRVTIASHDPSGARHTSRALATLRMAGKHH
ncbi:MAG: hypothetical protein JWM60_1934 [Solirubrobacterales bacterium]|nr:hypothetical protein [Solirubrobacterales bacterium]